MFQEYFLYLAIVLLFLDLQRLFLHVKNQDEKFNTIIVFTYRVPVFFYKIFLPAALILKNETYVTLSKLPPLNCIKLEANHLLESV